VTGGRTSSSHENFDKLDDQAQDDVLMGMADALIAGLTEPDDGSEEVVSDG
jgi:hypothetical protein